VEDQTKMRIDRDKSGQPMIEWQQAQDGWKRAWIRTAPPEKDWAHTGQYLHVVRVDAPFSGTSGNSTDFPIFNDLPAEQILEAFVQSVCAITGCQPVQAPPESS
jgi:hypothetical protein